jgi:hypothetical protein
VAAPLTPNGPAIKFVFGAEPTGVPPAGFIVLSTHVSKAEGSECVAQFLPSRYKVSYVLARSRYKLSKWPLLSPGAEF